MKKRRKPRGHNASEAGKTRWAKLTDEQRREQMAKIQAQRDMSPEVRKQIGQKLTEARKKKWMEKYG